MRNLGEYLAVLAAGDAFQPKGNVGNSDLISAYCKASSEFYDAEACRKQGGVPEVSALQVGSPQKFVPSGPLRPSGATAPAGGSVCPLCPTCPVCPAPEACPVCPAPEACPVCPAPAPATAQGFAWWWLVVAFAGGYGLAKMR